jgi:hypothetical protein
MASPRHWVDRPRIEIYPDVNGDPVFVSVHNWPQAVAMMETRFGPGTDASGGFTHWRVPKGSITIKNLSAK